MQKDIFQEMADKWPSAIVARTEIETFTGGLISSKYMANLDCLGEHCPPRLRIGMRKIAYPVRPLVAWLRKRSTSK